MLRRDLRLRVWILTDKPHAKPQRRKARLARSMNNSNKDIQDEQDGCIDPVYPVHPCLFVFPIRFWKGEKGLYIAHEIGNKPGEARLSCNIAR